MYWCAGSASQDACTPTWSRSHGMNFAPAHQAAGHDGCMAAGPVFAKRASVQEIAFYTHTASSDAALGNHISHWMPTFMGTLQEGQVAQSQGQSQIQVTQSQDQSQSQPQSQPQQDYIVLSNLYYGYSHPCILDIKLGAVLTDDSVTPEKRLRLQTVSKNTTSGSLGFRICGMKIFHSSSAVPASLPGSHASAADGYVSFDKNFGKALTAQNVSAAIEHFFVPLRRLKRAVLTRFLQRLQLLYNCLLDTEVRIKSGSVFLIYDADLDASGLDEEAYWDADAIVQDYPDFDSDSDSEPTGLSSLHLIDFAHAEYTPGQGPDDNVLEGVENLIAVFDQILRNS